MKVRHGRKYALTVDSTNPLAFLDLTTPVRDIMLSRYPHISKVPADAANGLDTALPPPPPITWSGRGNLIPARDPTLRSGPADIAGPSRQSSSNVEHEDAERDIDDSDGQENETDDTLHVPHSWHDVALSIGAEIMNEIRAQVRDRLGYTTSAGIARNKFLAKVRAYNYVASSLPNNWSVDYQLSASFKKPNHQVLFILFSSSSPSD